MQDYDPLITIHLRAALYQAEIISYQQPSLYSDLLKSIPYFGSDMVKSKADITDEGSTTTVTLTRVNLDQHSFSL